MVDLTSTIADVIVGISWHMGENARFKNGHARAETRVLKRQRFGAYLKDW